MFYYIEVGINKLLALFKLGMEKCEESVNLYQCVHAEIKKNIWKRIAKEM